MQVAADGCGQQGVDGDQLGLASSGRERRRPAVSCTVDMSGGASLSADKDGSQ